MPDERLMTKWLPSIRWGSLEFEIAEPRPSLIRLDAQYSFQPWMNQSTLQSVQEGGATSWIAATDYYRFPHVQYFASVASLVQKLRSLPLAAVTSGMRGASQKIRSQTLAAYSRVMEHLLGIAIDHLDSSSYPFAKSVAACSCFFLRTDGN